MSPATVPSPPVLLAHSYFLAFDEKQVRKMKPYPPLATLLAGAALRERGFPVALFDAMVAAGEGEFEASLRETKPRIVGLLEDNFNFLTKMCTTRMREAALHMIGRARAQGCRVAVNSSDATDQVDRYLAAGADAVIVGETEQVFPDLVEAWVTDPDADLTRVRGLALPAANGASRARYTPAPPPIEDLDRLPFPAWDLVDVSRYRAAWLAAHGRLSWNVVTSRGCPYGCNWCAKPVFGRRYAQRSPGHVAEELRRLRDHVEPGHVWFADDIFGLTPRWIEAFAGEVRARAAAVPFTMQSRVNLMTPTAVAALADARCEEVWLGVESGSQGVIDAMDKGTSIPQVRDATRTLKERGIRVGWFLQLGYPGEEWPDVLRTRDLVRDARPDDVGVSVAYPLPGTGFYQRVQTQLREQRNWQTSDDLAMLFRGTYTTPFYRLVRDLLHDEVGDQPGGNGAGRRALDARWADLGRRGHEYRSGNGKPG